jgi:hypothetical protein
MFKIIRASLGLALLLPLLAACSSSPANENTGNGSGGAGGSGNGGAGGSGNGGAGGAETCDIGTQDKVTWSLTLPSGQAYPPADPAADKGKPPVDITLVGQVKESDPGTIRIDTCSPAADCIPLIATLTISAKGLPAQPIPKGALVQLHYRSEYGTDTHTTSYTAMHLVIENVPNWDGLPNPVATGQNLWLAAHEHFVTGGPNSLTASFDPFLVERVDLCTKSDTGNPVYAMRFAMKDIADGKTLLLKPGEEGKLVVAAGATAGTYTLHNLRSFDYLDANQELAYWIVGAPKP